MTLNVGNDDRPLYRNMFPLQTIVVWKISSIFSLTLSSSFRSTKTAFHKTFTTHLFLSVSGCARLSSVVNDERHVMPHFSPYISPFL